MVEIVNVVGSGSLGVELDLEELTDDIGEPLVGYDPEKHPGMYLRFEEDEPLITVYRTGKYIITAGDSEEECYLVRERFLQFFSDIGVLEQPEDEKFSIRNYVCTGELGEEQNLNALALQLGFEDTEYEPEQFPGLIYRPESHDCVILIFTSGRVVITGARTYDLAEQAFQDIQQRLFE